MVYVVGDVLIDEKIVYMLHVHTLKLLDLLINIENVQFPLVINGIDMVR
jgi:hypothetical protein